jgi:hypothetical protein
MKQHKWAKEIKAWADGKTIECRQFDTHRDAWLLWQDCDMFTLSQSEHFSSDKWQVRIKPQPKEPQYLYVSRGLDGRPAISFIDNQYCIGKIKLEVNDE